MGGDMKVVTVRQPFASLIAVGAKTLLDQARPTGYRGRFLIRAALAPTYFEAATLAAVKNAMLGSPMGYPHGVVVASCELVDCVPTVTNLDHPWPDGRALHAMNSLWLVDVENDHADNVVRVPDPPSFGDFTRGRWVWLLDDMRPTTERCPRCWGAAIFYEPDPYSRDADGEHPECPTCKGAGVCPPVRMRGGPGLRNPEWETTP